MGFDVLLYFVSIKCRILNNLFIAIIGAGVSVLGALYIFRETIQTDIKNKKEEEERFL